MAAEVHGVPHDPEREGAEDAERDEERRGVLGVDGVVDAEEHGGADDGDGEGEEDEGEPVADSGGDEGDGDGVEPGDGEGGDRVQLGLRGGVLEPLDDGGEEVGDAVGCEGAAFWTSVFPSFLNAKKE